MDLVALARTHTREAIETLVAICRDPAVSPGSRVTVACTLLDRGYGRPFQALAIAHGQSHTPRNRCVRFVFGVAAASRNARFQAAR